MSGQRAQFQHKESSKQTRFSKKVSKVEQSPETFTGSPLLSLVQRDPTQPDMPLTPQIISLFHRTIGNRAAGHIIQAKLKIKKAGDQYEREADLVAKQVMRMPERKVVQQGQVRVAGPVSLQRKPGRPWLDEFRNEELLAVYDAFGYTPDPHRLPDMVSTILMGIQSQAGTIRLPSDEKALVVDMLSALFDSVVADAVESALAQTHGTKVEPAQAIDFEEVHQAIGEAERTPIDKPGRVARPEWNIRRVPEPTVREFRRLKLNDAVFVESKRRNPGETLAWYQVVTERGEMGWMRSDGIALDPPEPSSLVHYVETDQTLLAIAGRYYGSDIKPGEDARFYVAALSFANRERAGIIFPEGFTEEDWQRRTTWEKIKVKTDHAIWIPDASFLRRLRGHVRSGSITGGLWARTKAVAEFVWDWTRYGVGVVAGILRGALECLYDLFAGVVHLIQAVWSVLKSLVTGNIVSDARALWDAIVNLDIAGLWEGFVDNWNASDPWDRGMFRGRVIGYVAVEIALAVFSVGALTAVKWVGRFARVTSRLASVRKVEEVARTVSRSRRMAEVPESAAREMRRRFEGGAPTTRAEAPPAARRPVDPEVEAMVERGIVEGATTTGPARHPRPQRPATTGRAETARRQFNQDRNRHAERLGVRSGGQVHHAIELQVLDRYPGVFNASDLNAFNNMRGIATEVAQRRQLHNSKIREMWDRHYRTLDDQIARRGLEPGTKAYRDYVRRYLTDARDEIDYVLGQFFTEYRTGRPRSFE